MNELRSMASALGGDVVKGRKGSFILCPGPGHSAKDRSLSVTPSKTDPDGFVCFSHANNDWRDCRDHVRARLGTVRKARADQSAPDVDRVGRDGKSYPAKQVATSCHLSGANAIWKA